MRLKRGASMLPANRPPLTQVSRQVGDGLLDLDGVLKILAVLH